MEARQLFEILVRENVDSVRAFVMSSVRDATVADDIVQEAFVVAWKNLDRYDRQRPFGPWVRGIAGKLILSHRRKLGRSKVMYLDDEVLTVLDGAFDKIQALSGDTFDDKLDALRDCLAALTDSQRDTIALHYEEGMQCKDIAPKLGLGVEAVKKHLQRGRASLLKCIEGKLGTELVQGGGVTDRLEGLGDWDDTLDEPAARDGAPPPELAAELVRQRVAHGLLASLGRSADAAGRERFVESIFARLRDVDGAATVDADALVAHDDSLDDTVEGDGAPPAALRDELVRQRVVHGLLRAERAAREGAARDALVERIVGAAAGGRVLGFPGSWTRIAAAAAIVVAATFGLTKLLGRGGRDPRLEAASREMSKSADRRFQVMVKRIDVTPKQVTGMHDLWLRPMDDGALRFRLEVDGLRAGRQRIGSDGIKVWRTNLDDVNDREEVDVAHGDEVFRHLQDRSRGHAALDDPVHFDVGRLLRILAIDGIASAEGEPIDNGRGGVWQLFYAATLTHADFGTLTSVLVLVDEATCLIEALEFVRRDADGTFRYRFDYMSSEPQEQSIYFRPW